jgi:hypothetical protein
MKTSKAPRAAKTAKSERRSRRESKRRGDHDHRWDAIAPEGIGGMRSLRRALRQVTAGLGDVDLGGGWPDLAPKVLPLLKRVRQPFPVEAAPVHLRVPPGVWTGFGIDIGPAWAHVSRDLIDRWGIDDATVLGAALENLRRRVAEEPPRVERTSFADVPATVVQAQGWGSALILAPDGLGEILGSTRHVLLTPVRDALIALPEDLDVDLAVAIWEAFAEGGHDELDVDPLCWTGSQVVAVDDGVDVLPIH